MSWTPNFEDFGISNIPTPSTKKILKGGFEKAINNVTTIKVGKNRAAKIRKAASARVKITDKENTVKEVKTRGTWKSSITGKEYRSKARAYAAGEAAKRQTGKINLNNPEEEYIYRKATEKAEETKELNKKRKEIRDYYKSKGEKVNLRNKKKGEIKALYEQVQRNKEIEKRNAEIEKQMEYADEFEYDEDEWEEVERPKTVKRTKELNEIPVYWEDFDGKIIQNPWAWEHGSGSWLYVHGYDYWDLNRLLFDLDVVCSDGNSSRMFIEYALANVPRLCKYTLAEAENGEWHIYFK